MARPVQKIAVVNEGAYVMSFGLEVFDPNTGVQFIVDGLDTGNYPVGQMREIDLPTTGLAVGAFVRPQIRPVWGSSNVGNVYVEFQPDGQVATYEASGTTLFNSWRLID